jgi:uncharacterized surface protein with fasciclin (FAS1) repeats
MRRLLAIGGCALVSLGLLAAPAAAAGRPAPSGTVVDVAVGASGGGTLDRNPFDYDILVQAVLTAGLDTTLADPDGTFTVFAPNDLAFKRLAKDLSGTWPASEQAALDTIVGALTELGGGDPLPVLREVLLYHVVAGEALGVKDVLRADSVTVANGATIARNGFRLQDAATGLKDPRLTVPLNLQATNGVVHTINRVLIPVDL